MRLTNIAGDLWSLLMVENSKQNEEHEFHGRILDRDLSQDHISPMWGNSDLSVTDGYKSQLVMSVWRAERPQLSRLMENKSFLKRGMPLVTNQQYKNWPPWKTKKKKVITGVIYKAFKKCCNAHMHTHTPTQQRTFRNGCTQEIKIKVHRAFQPNGNCAYIRPASSLNFSQSPHANLLSCIFFSLSSRDWKAASQGMPSVNYQQCYVLKSSAGHPLWQDRLIHSIIPTFARKFWRLQSKASPFFCPSRCWVWPYRTFFFC